jgi:uncharacterized protein (TIRG00374 family)
MMIRRIRLLWLGIAVSIGFLYLALRGMDWPALVQTMLDMQIESVTLCAVMIALGVTLRGLRWNLIAGRSMHPVIPFVRATNLGMLGNQLLPARLGEVVRIVALRRILKISLSKLVGSALIDRVFDVLVLFIAACLVSTVMARTALPQNWLLGLGAALVLLGVGMLIVRTNRFNKWVTACSTEYLHRWSLHPDSFITELKKTLSRLSHWRSGSSVVAVALLIFLTDYLAVLAALRCFGLDLPTTAPLMLWVTLAASSSIPSAPGHVGLYQLAAVMALAAYDVPAHEAIAVSLVLQVLMLLVPLVGTGGEVRRLWSAASCHPKD